MFGDQLEYQHTNRVMAELRECDQFKLLVEEEISKAQRCRDEGVYNSELYTEIVSEARAQLEHIAELRETVKRKMH